MKNLIAWIWLLFQPKKTITDHEFYKYTEGKPISAELAMKLLQGDKKAVKELRKLSN